MFSTANTVSHKGYFQQENRCENGILSYHALLKLFYSVLYVQTVPPKTSQLKECCSEISLSSCLNSATNWEPWSVSAIARLEPNTPTEKISNSDNNTGRREAGRSPAALYQHWTENIRRIEMSSVVQEQAGSFNVWGDYLLHTLCSCIDSNDF